MQGVRRYKNKIGSSFFLEKDPESAHYTLWRRRNPAIAPDPLAGGRREEIARGLRGLRFEYYDGYDWFDSWGSAERRSKERDLTLAPSNLNGLPEAVRVTVWVDPSPRPPAASQHSPTNEPPTTKERSDVSASQETNDDSRQSDAHHCRVMTDAFTVGI